MPVAALQFKKFEKGALCGFLAIRYHGLTIRDCRLMENKGGGFWVALPQKEVTIDGERKWVDLLQLGRDEQDFLNRQVVGQLRQRGDLPGGRQQGPAPLRRSSERDHEPGLEDYFPQAQDDDVDF